MSVQWRLATTLLCAALLCACVQPTTAPTATPQPLDLPQTIVLDSPAEGATVASPLVLRGSTAVLPAGGRLNYRIFDADGGLISNGALPVMGQPQGPGRFEGTATFVAPAGAGRVEILELLPDDGSVRASTSVRVQLSGGELTPTLAATPAGGTPAPTTLATLPPGTLGPQAITIESPPPGTTVGSPVTVTGRTSSFPPGGTLQYLVRDAAGRQIGAGGLAVAQEGAGGRFVASLTFSEPPGGGLISVEIAQPGAATAVIPLTVAPPQAITIDSPPPGTTVGSPMTITGRTARYPFQGALAYQVLDAAGARLGAGLVAVEGGAGQPGRFVAELLFALPAAGGDIRIELVDEDAASRVVAARAAIALRVAPQGAPTSAAPTATGATPAPTALTATPSAAGQIVIERPTPGATVGAPLSLSGRVSATPSSGQLRYRVRDASGRVLGEGGIVVNGGIGQPGTFAVSIAFTAPDRDGPIVVEVLDADLSGVTRASALVIVQFSRQAPYPAP